MESTYEQQQLTLDESEARLNSLLEQNSSYEAANQRCLEDIQQYELTIIQKDDTIRNQQDLFNQTEQRYAELEQKHRDQHELMVKLSTHLAAKESESQNTILTTTTTNESNVNETWNTILSMNNYLRVENTRLVDDLERTRLENAQLNERSQTIEQDNLTNQQTIDELKLKNQSLEHLQAQYDQDQERIQNLQEKNVLLEQEKDNLRQNNDNFQLNINQLNDQKNRLNQQIQQAETKGKASEEQLMIKTTEIEDLKMKLTKLEAENQELKQMTTRVNNQQQKTQ